MALEQYANNTITTVASGGYTSGSGVLNVASTGSPWPAITSGLQFHVLVYRVITGVATPIVNLKVTAINSGTQWAVTAEGTDANALAGDIVLGVLSSAGMDQIRSDQFQVGTLAALPSTTGQKKGNQYKPTDSSSVFYFDGSAWVEFTAPAPALYTSSYVPFTQVVPSDFAWYNQHQATESTFNGIPILQNANTTGVQQYQIRATALPGTKPFRVRALFSINPSNNTGDSEVGLVLANSATTECFSLGFANNNGSANIFRSHRQTSWSNGSGGNNFDNSTSNLATPIEVWLQYRDDGTNRYFDASADGVIFVNYFSGSNTDFTVPDLVGYFVAGFQTTTQIAVRSWLIEATAALN